MKRILNCCLVLLMLAALPGTALAGDAADQISVTGVSADPGVLMRGDTGTIEVRILNSGLESVPISRARLLSNDITILSGERYSSVGTIGAGNSMTFTFSVRADSSDGIYYPVFYLDFRDAGSLRYGIPVKVESSPLSVSITERPETFSMGKKESIKILVGNPRENQISGVVVTPVSEEASFTQSSYFIGSLLPDASSGVSFEVEPLTDGELLFDVEYRNGLNWHKSSLALPMVLGEGRKIAEPLLNNLEIRKEGDHWYLTGDVNNAGLETAHSVVVIADDPAEPVMPYPLYVTGALDPDDFSSFDLTFRTETGVESVPLLISFRDEDGNRFETTDSVALSASSPSSSSGGDETEGWSPLMIGLVVLLIAGVAVAIVLAWKRK